MSFNNVDVGLVGKNIHVSIADIKGKKYVDVRRYFVSQAGETLPTKKGITIAKDEINAIIAILEKAEGML